MAKLFEGDSATVSRLGFSFELNLSDNLQRCLFLTGTYEPEFLAFLEAEIKPGDIYIDVGAHIGLDALIVARKLAGSGRVVCFEPSPDSAEAIRRGVVRNDLADLVTIVECGLGDEEGTLLLRSDPAFSDHDQGVRSRYSYGNVVVEARLRRFDDWAEETQLDRMDVVKLDVEAGEYFAVAGMERSLTSLHPRLVVVEVNGRMAWAGTSEEMLDDLLDRCGYSRTGQVFIENVVYGLR